ncbi:hypothetical protein NF27_ER00050 [Candidatus Jidaibacter acanthamoeba]|uniref:Uncharacterized protein n=1 Tax=Candidatus Jidaibacter acanthamoebae TaxID=86105 RepID=A0A0C1MSV5_9RICK|nr:hypothetical protein [Candidatus Jidaibacter acanthamoeba]KIE05162.1 hypothetical protein NF27_ER00050 [Candidatus Jidaibacter acanthamoeba]
MKSTVYQNKMFYYNLMQDFVKNKISGREFQQTFLKNRTADLNKDQARGYYDYSDKMIVPNNIKLFREEYAWKLYNNFDELVKGAEKYGVKGEEFFTPIFNCLQSIDIEDFWPRDDEYFEEDENIDEDELRRRVKEKLRILDENKDKW